MKHLKICLYRALWIWLIRTFRLCFVRDYQDLYRIALWEIKRLKAFGQVSMVSAPLFSGGTGKLKENLKILKRYCRSVSSEKEIVWSQMPYLDSRVKKLASMMRVNTCKKIEEFYVPLIQSGSIAKLICIGFPFSETSLLRYRDSLGCQTEREAAIAAGIKIQGIPYSLT